MVYKVIVLILLFKVCIVRCQTLSDRKALQTQLFNGYDKGVTPVLNQSEPLQVNVSAFIVSLNSFEEVTETLSLTAGLGLNWIDPSLVWDPAAFGSIESTIIPTDDIWIPPVFLLNSADSLEPVGSDTKFYSTLFSNGLVHYLPGGVMLAKCPADIAKFPFDTQTCTVLIGPWGMTSQYLNFISVYNTTSLEFFTPHSDWTLEDHSTTTIDMNGYIVFQMTLKIKRQPLYYAVMIILPTLLFSLLNPLVFILPVESGERISLAMTILLSYAIFLTLVSASIPPTSNPMCVLLVIMVVIIALSGIIVIGTIMSTKYYHQDEIHGGIVKKMTMKFVKPAKNNVLPIDDKCNNYQSVTGKDASHLFDVIFFLGSYVAIILSMCSYFIYVTI